MVVFFILIGIIELTLTIYEDSLSKDLAHINSFERISNNNNDILVIGNSLTREGINSQLIERNINNRMKPKLKIGYIYPDDTSVIEWYHIFVNYYFQPKIYPKNLFIIFAQDQLASSKIQFEEIQRISKYTQFESLFNIIIDEGLSLSQSIDLYLSKVFRLYSNRERIKKRILDIMPNYRTTVRKLNKKLKPNESKTEVKRKYSHLNKLIELINKLNIQTTFIAIPISKPYIIDTELIKIINNSQYCRLVDFQSTTKYKENDFIDGYHLGQDGASKFTDQLVEIILSIK